MMRFRRLAIVFVALGMFNLTPRPAIAQDVAQLLPAKSDRLFYVNVEQTLRSDVFKKHLAQPLKDELDKNRIFEDFVKITGFNPFTDLKHIVLTGAPTEKDKGLPTLYLFVATGKFDGAKIMAAFAKEAAKPDNQEMLEMVRVKDRDMVKLNAKTQAATHEIFLTVVDSERLIFGPKEHVMQALDRAARKAAPVVGKDISDRLVRVNPTTVFYGTAPDFLATSGGLDEPGLQKIWQSIAADPAFARLLKKITQTQLDFRVNTDARLIVTLTMSDVDAAQEIKPHIQKMCDTGKGFIDLAVFANPKIQHMADLGKNLAVTSKGSTITIQTLLSATSIEALVKAAKEQ